MLRRPDAAELAELARARGITLSQAEQTELRTLSDRLIEQLDALEDQGTPPPPVVEANRDPGRRPEPGEDPYNAIVRWCRVTGHASGLLSGKRISLKDTIGVAGVPLTCGSRALAGFVPAADSVVVERVLQAGGEIVAMTNMDDFALSAGGESSHYGPTLNPFDRSRSAGGSSGGAAAALSTTPSISASGATRAARSEFPRRGAA